MQQTQEPGKRIVSKGAYAKAKFRKAFLFCAALSFFATGATSIFAMWQMHSVSSSGNLDVGYNNIFLVFVVLFMIAGCLYLAHLGKLIVKQAKEIDAGVPLTRANTADLPAPDSLVRASSEPVHTQEAVLLRAATSAAQEKQEEQLLRAAEGR